jgi:hypothetical protein
MTKLTPYLDWEPVRNRREVRIPKGAMRLNVGALCRRAGIRELATYDRVVIVYRGRRKVRTPGFDLIGVRESPRSQRGALRALESLAYSFFDPCARHCLAQNDVFTV